MTDRGAPFLNRPWAGSAFSDCPEADLLRNKPLQRSVTSSEGCLSIQRRQCAVQPAASADMQLPRSHVPFLLHHWTLFLFSVKFQLCCGMPWLKETGCFLLQQGQEADQSPCLKSSRGRSATLWCPLEMVALASWVQIFPIWTKTPGKPTTR